MSPCSKHRSEPKWNHTQTRTSTYRQTCADCAYPLSVNVNTEPRSWRREDESDRRRRRMETEKGKPQVRCNRVCHRRCEWCPLPLCLPYTSQSLLSLCVLHCPAGHCPALDLCGSERERERILNDCNIWCACVRRFSSCLVPVYDSFVVQEEQTQRYLSCIEPANIKISH